jgi:hypothetical protein
LSVVSPHHKFEFLCFCRSEVWRHFFQTSFLTILSLFRYILLKHFNYICFCFKFLCHGIWRESLKIHQVASNLNCFVFLSVFFSFRIAICLFFVIWTTNSVASWVPQVCAVFSLTNLKARDSLQRVGAPKTSLRCGPHSNHLRRQRVCVGFELPRSGVLV